MTTISGGPAPVAFTPPVAVGNATENSHANEHHAAVAAVTQAPEDRKPERAVAASVKSTVSSHEASARYDTRGKVSDDHYTRPDHNKGRHVDREV